MNLRIRHALQRKDRGEHPISSAGRSARPAGLVARVASFLAERGGNVVDAQQFDDGLNDRFFMRVAFQPGENETLDAFRHNFTAVAENWG